MKNILKLLLVSVLCFFLCACDLLIYPVAGFYISYELEVPVETRCGDFLRYSFSVQNPYRGRVALGVTYKSSDSFESRPNDTFVVQRVGDDGKIEWEDSGSEIYYIKLPYNRIGTTTFQISINDEKILYDLKIGEREMGMAIIRLADIKLGPYFSTEIGKVRLIPEIVPMVSDSASDEKIRKE